MSILMLTTFHSSYTTRQYQLRKENDMLNIQMTGALQMFCVLIVIASFVDNIILKVFLDFT